MVVVSPPGAVAILDQCYRHLIENGDDADLRRAARACADLSFREARQDDGECEKEQAAGNLPKRFFASQRGHHIAQHLEWTEPVAAKQDRVENAGEGAAGYQAGAEERAGAQIGFAGFSGLALHPPSHQTAGENRRGGRDGKIGADGK